MAKAKKLKSRKTRQARIRKKISGTEARPRLSVFRSSRYIYAQIIDDNADKTLVSCSSFEKALRSKVKSGGNKEAAKEVGKELASRAKTKNINTVTFDRSGRAYTGRIHALAEGAREAGLKF